MSDEEDYMSESFLQNLVDKRPGLVFSSKTSRAHKQEKKKREKDDQNRVKPKKVLETEKREEGLKSAITSDNKGFALLSKMGYKPGMAIGKKGEGRSEPVPIELKAGRGGLGRDNEVKRKLEDFRAKSAIAQEKRQKVMSEAKQNFVGRMSNKFSEQRANSDLYKSQKVCADLDARINLAEPERQFFWPDTYKKQDESDEESNECEKTEEDSLLSSVEQLEILTDYLRTRHLYCVWCGTAYEDAQDLETNCPGNTAELHDD
ncbi:G patch domain-containing protein 11-like [Saccostrea cucullata]|uniref:G patch domain-containing protein 11-like n=1 Tax=Saccostrea cuccullata TaxID=36930 RepID=UPI002ED090A0